MRTIIFHHTFDYGFEDAFVGGVVDAVAKGKVDGVILSSAYADVAQFTCAREVLTIFVEGDGHNAVRGIEGFFYAVAVVDVDVDVEDALVVSEELEDSEDNIYKVR